MYEIRPVRPEDREAVIELVRTAFREDGRDGEEEVGIVRDTWRLGAHLPGLELAGFEGADLCGHVLGARANLGGRPVVAVAPLAVAPAHQGQGLGSELMTQLIATADAQGWPAVVLLGSPEYYSRFGFEPSGPFGIVYPPVGEGSVHFQVRRLSAFDSTWRGTLRYCWESDPAR